VCVGIWKRGRGKQARAEESVRPRGLVDPGLGQPEWLQTRRQGSRQTGVRQTCTQDIFSEGKAACTVSDPFGRLSASAKTGKHASFEFQRPLLIAEIATGCECIRDA